MSSNVPTPGEENNTVSEDVLSDSDIPEDTVINVDLLDHDDHSESKGDENGEISKDKLTSHRNSRSPSTTTSPSKSRSSSPSPSDSTSHSRSRSSSAASANDLPERMETVNIEENQQGQVSRAKRAKTPNKEARQEAKRQKVERLMEDIHQDFQKLKNRPNVIEKEQIESSALTRIDQLQHNIDGSYDPIPDKYLPDIRTRLRFLATEMELCRDVPRSLVVSSRFLGKGQPSFIQFQHDLVSNCFSYSCNFNWKHYIISIILTLLIIIGTGSATEMDNIDNNIHKMFVNRSATLKLLHPISRLQVMTFSESHDMGNFERIAATIDSLIATAKSLADYSVENKFCSTRRTLHAPAESSATIESSKLKPEISYALPHLEITSDFYKFESFAKNGTCFFRMNPDVAGILGDYTQFRWIEQYNWKWSKEKPVFDYAERGVRVEERTKYSRGVCKFYDFAYTKNKNTMNSYYQLVHMPTTRLMGCMIKCNQQSHCLYSVYNHKHRTCKLFARVIQEHEFDVITLYNHWYENYETIASAECSPTVVERARAYLMSNGTMVNLMDLCEYIDNDYHQDMQYQCSAFYEPVIQELQQQKHLLINYKEELKKKFTPVIKASPESTGDDDEELDQPSKTREKRGALGVILPFILQVARMIGKNYDRIIPITAQVTKFMDVTMPKIKNQIVKDGFKANINSDISYYAIEKPEKVQIQNFFDFKFDTRLIDFHQRLNRSFSETYEEIDKFRKLLEDSTPVVNHIPGGEYLFTRYFSEEEGALIRNFIYTTYSYNPYRLMISIPYDPSILQEQTWSVNSEKVVGNCISERNDALEVKQIFDGVETKCLSPNAVKTRISDEIFLLTVKDKLFFSNILVVNSLESAIRIVCPDKESFYPIHGFAIIAAGGHCHIFRNNALITPAGEGTSMIQTRNIWENDFIKPIPKSQVMEQTVIINNNTDIIQYVLLGILGIFQIVIAMMSNSKVKEKVKGWLDNRSSSYQVRQTLADSAQRLGQIPSRLQSRRSSLRRARAIEEGLAGTVLAKNVSKTEQTSANIQEII